MSSAPLSMFLSELSEHLLLCLANLTLKTCLGITGSSRGPVDLPPPALILPLLRRGRFGGRDADKVRP